jgi:predicted restriction endonuclease
LFADLSFDVASIEDERIKEESLRVIREGAADFKKRIHENWAGCAITGCSVASVVEAAHIVPYLGPITNDSRNGIALRTDVHVLFDRHLVSFEFAGDQLHVVVSAMLAGSEYADYDGAVVALPADRRCRPDREAIAWRSKQFRDEERERAARAPIADREVLGADRPPD